MAEVSKRQNKRRAGRERVSSPTPPGTPLKSPSLRRDIYLAAGVALIAFAAYANSIQNGFVYDDISAIVENTRLNAPGDIGTFFSTSYWSDGRGALYRPLTLLSFAWDRALFGPGPLPVHAVNVVANAVLAATVFLFLRGLTANPTLAALAAVLFAVHPVHTEVVANGVGRAEILSALFLMLAAWVHLLLVPRAGPGRGRISPRARAWLSPVPPLAFLIALLFKESAVVLPILLFLGEWLVLDEGKIPRGSRILLRYGVYIPPLVLFLILRGAAVGNRLPEIQEVMGGLDPAGRFLFASATLLAYTGQILVPWKLCCEYSDYRGTLPSVWSHPQVAASLLAGAAAVLLAVWLYRRRVLVPLFGMAWFFAAILPVSNLLFPIGTVRADRLLFIPSLGFAVAAAWLILRIAGRRPWIAVVLIVPLLTFYGWRTVTRNAEWKSQETLWTTDIRKNQGSPVGWAFLGQVYLDRGDLDRALDAYRRSFTLRDRLGFYPESHNNYARILTTRGEVAEAERQYRLVLSRTPGQFTALVNLGEMKLHADSTRAEAVDLLTRAAAVKPKDFMPWANLSQAYWLTGRRDSALIAIDRAIRLRPDLQNLQETKQGILRATGLSPDPGKPDAGTASNPAPRLLDH